MSICWISFVYRGVEHSDAKFRLKITISLIYILTETKNCSSTSSTSSKTSKWPRNRISTDTDRLYCPPSWMCLCTVMGPTTALLFNPLKFAKFHNQSSLGTMLKLISLRKFRQFIIDRSKKKSASLFAFLIIYMKRSLVSDWLRVVQFKCNTSATRLTSVQNTHRNSVL